MSSIKDYKKLKDFAVMMNICFVCCSGIVMADPKIDKAGNTILALCRNLGYWLCIIMCTLEVLRNLMQGDTRGIARIISKYAMGFGTLYFLPWLFDLIKSIFN